MSDVSREKKSVGVRMGIYCALFCLAAGTFMNFRPFIILARALVSFTIASVLGCVLVVFIHKYTHIVRTASHEHKDAHAAPVQEEETDRAAS